MFELELSAVGHDAWGAGEPHPIADALQQRGVDAEGAAAAAELLTQTRTAPALEGRLEIRRGGVTTAHDLAIGPGLVARPAPPAVGPVTVGVVATFPRLIADLVDLGPRPFSDRADEILIPEVVADAFLGTGAPQDDLDEITELLSGLYSARALRGLLGPESTRWSLNIWTQDDGESPQTRIDVVDAGKAGLWLIGDGPTDDSVSAAPVNATSVWLLISSALDSALAQASR